MNFLYGCIIGFIFSTVGGFIVSRLLDDKYVGYYIGQIIGGIFAIASVYAWSIWQWGG